MFAVLLLSHAAYADDLSEKHLAAKWIYQVQQSQTSVECPDVLQIQNDGAYLILNDCFGPSAKHPITEKGNWSLSSDNKKLLLRNRVFETNYYFGSKSNEMAIDIESASKNELILFIDGREQKYKRIE